jgi:hypothetical protein
MWAFLLLIAEVLIEPNIPKAIKYPLTDLKGAAVCVSARLVTVIDTDATHHHQSRDSIAKQKSTTTSCIHVRVCPLAEKIMVWIPQCCINCIEVCQQAVGHLKDGS